MKNLISIPLGAIISCAPVTVAIAALDFNSSWCDYKLHGLQIEPIRSYFNSSWCDYKDFTEDVGSVKIAHFNSSWCDYKNIRENVCPSGTQFQFLLVRL